MSLDPSTIASLAEYLESAQRNATAVTKITDRQPDMSWDDAYAVQHAIRLRREARGARVCGLKAGLTSHAKMKQMGVETPVFGLLFDDYARPDGGEISTADLIHPKVEAEIAFMIGRPLHGPGCHIGQVLAATEFVMPAVEVIDSRYENFRFDLKSVIADNTSASRFVVGGCARPAEGLDLRTLGCVLERNGEPMALAAGAAVLGHPAAAIAMMANWLGAQGKEIPAGTFIMTGGMTEAVAVKAGDNVTVRIQSLGSVSMRFV